MNPMNPDETRVAIMRGHILLGGPMRKISVGGKIYEFEMHRYCGPTLLNRNGEPRKYQPMQFLKAASLWAQQGEKIDENGLCIWFHEPTNITKHLGGRHYLFIRQEPGKQGS